MEPDLAARLRRVIGTYLGVDPADLTSPGSTVVRDDGQDADGWITLFPAGGHVVAEVPAPLLDAVTALTDALPRDHRLTGGDLAGVWPDRDLEVEPNSLSILHPPAFDPRPPADGASVRLLDASDREAFDAFHARCSHEDRDEALVDIDHLAAGVLVDGRIVAVASTFDWCGFVDIGVLTDPEHRRRGHGAAAVSAVCSELLDSGRVASYRYAEDNLGSRRLAASLGLVPIPPLVRVRAKPHA